MKITTKILLAFLLILMLSILDTLSNYALSVKVESNIRFLNTSQEIIRESGELQREILQMQSAFRGFLLTDDSIFLDGYESSLKITPLLIADLQHLVVDAPRQSSLLDSIVNDHRQWIAYASALVKAKMNEISHGHPGVFPGLFNNSFRKYIGKDLNDQISKKFSTLNSIEYHEREIHLGNLSASIQRTHLYSWSFFTLTILIGVLTVVLVMRHISKRIQSMVELAESISIGKFIRIQDHNKDELSSLSTSLNRMSSNLDTSIRQLEARNAELDKFAYVVSHDLKAPIRGIYNVIKWIDEDIGHELSGKMKEFLEIISNRTLRMEHMINGLLEYARLRTQAPSTPTDIHAMVMDLGSELIPKNYKLDLINLPVILTEQIRLEQIFSNLISNAVKFTSAENGHIEISSMQKPDYFEFTVKDNGIGIDPSYHNKIFEIFQTLEVKKDGDSTGIGLSIVKKILDEHGEKIFVTSSVGSGSAFTFTWHAKKL